MPVFEILSSDMQRVKARAPGSFKAQVGDAERRLNILFDHLNNEDLLKPNTVDDMANLARAIQNRDYETARSIHVSIMTNRTDECGNWMVRDLSCRLRLSALIRMSITTGWCQASDWHEQGHALNDIPVLGCQGPVLRESMRLRRAAEVLGSWYNALCFDFFFLFILPLMPAYFLLCALRWESSSDQLLLL